MEFRLKDVSLSVDEINGKRIGGYINVTNRESEVLFSKRRNKYFKEIMQSGVFQESINEGRNIPLLLEHNYEKQLADLQSGTLELREDQIGLRFDAVINDEEVYQKVKEGKINSCSFGFSVLEDSFEPINSRLEKRYVRKIKLDEVSLVSNPAYVGSLCETRALEEELKQEELNQDVTPETEEKPKVEEDKKDDIATNKAETNEQGSDEQEVSEEGRELEEEIKEEVKEEIKDEIHDEENVDNQQLREEPAKSEGIDKELIKAIVLEVLAGMSNDKQTTDEVETQEEKIITPQEPEEQKRSGMSKEVLRMRTELLKLQG